MARQLYTNNATSTLAEGISDSATSLTLATGGGALFAAPADGDWQMLTLANADGTLVEIVKATARSGDVLTVERAQEGTTALAWATDDKVQARLTAGMLGQLVANKSTNINTLTLLSNEAPSAPGSVVIGNYAQASGSSTVAIGSNAKADGNYGVSIGQGRANAPYSVCLGGGRAFRAYQSVSNTHPCIPRDDWMAGGGSQWNSGMESVFASQFAELGVPATWAANTNYTDGATVQPTTPNGWQYYLWHGDYDVSVAANAHNSGPTEPAWPASADASVGVGTSTGAWLSLKPSLGIKEVIPDDMVFYPTEVGFICFNHSGVTAAPFVSIGTAANPTLLVNNQQLSDITAAQMRHAFAGLKHGMTGDILFTLITSATGAAARFHGRFYAKGIFIQTQG